MRASLRREATLVCATDAGGAKRTRKMADELQAGLQREGVALQVGFMMADKFRPKAGEVGQAGLANRAQAGLSGCLERKPLSHMT